MRRDDSDSAVREAKRQVHNQALIQTLEVEEKKYCTEDPVFPKWSATQTSNNYINVDISNNKEIANGSSMNVNENTKLTLNKSNIFSFVPEKYEIQRNPRISSILCRWMKFD